MSIVKEIDRISGTDTRSKNIEDAVKKLESSGDSSGDLYEIKVLSKGDWDLTGAFKKLTGFSIDKTNGQEIRDAYLSGKEVFFIIDDYGDGRNLHKFVLTSVMPSNNGLFSYSFVSSRDQHYNYIDLEFSSYSPTYSYWAAYAGYINLLNTSTAS